MIREISYKVTENKVEPSTKQWLGMQREDCATVIKFDISKMPNYLSYDWRIDFDQASAGYSAGTSIGNNGSIISRPLPYDMTRFGGDVQITLVGSKNGEIVYSIPVKGYLTAVSQSEKSDDNVSIDITSAQVNAQNAALSAEKSAKNAAASAENAKESQVLTEEARRALEEGAEFVFLGGDAKGSAEVDLVVDDELSEYSRNPVENREVAKEVKKLKTKRYLLIGDSYGQGSRAQVGVTGWAPLFKEKMGLSDDNCIINTLGGTGFCAGVSKSKNGITIDAGVDSDKEYKFFQLLYYTASIREPSEGETQREIIVTEKFPVKDPETITDIVVCGGYNDLNYTSGEIASAVNAFVTKAKELYPNALISIGMVGCSANIHAAAYTQKLAANSLQGYVGLLGTSTCAYRYLSNVEYALKLRPEYMYKKNVEGEPKEVNDGVHPTRAGYRVLANAIVKAVEGGFSPGYSSYFANMTGINNITIDTDQFPVVVLVKVNNAVTEIHIDSCLFELKEGLTISANTLIELAEFDSSSCLITGTHHDPENGEYNRTEFVTVSGHIKVRGSEQYTLFTGQAGVIDGKLCLVPQFLNDSNTRWAEDVPVEYLRLYQVHIVTSTNLY